jgi:transcriptional regulator with XRE-family HTH domain
MKDKINNERLNKLISKERPGWMDQADYYEVNKEWLDKSALIAIKILSSLRSQASTQRALADNIGVTPQYINKVVKGQENLSLETICKIEGALGISLIEVPTYETTQVLSDSFSTGTYAINRNESKLIGFAKSTYKSESKYHPHQELLVA